MQRALDGAATIRKDYVSRLKVGDLYNLPSDTSPKVGDPCSANGDCLRGMACHDRFHVLSGYCHDHAVQEGTVERDHPLKAAADFVNYRFTVRCIQGILYFINRPMGMACYVQLKNAITFLN